MTNNIQFNATSAKTFRATFEKYHKASHAIADILNECNDIVSNAQNAINTNKGLLDKIEAGEKIRFTREKLEAEIALCEDKIVAARDDRDEAKAKEQEYLAAGEALYTDAMHKGAAQAVATFGKDNSAWREALAAMLRENGLPDATADNVARFDFLVNVKVNSSKKVYEANALIGSASKKTSAKIFASAMTDYLVKENIISPYKHKYIPQSIRKKMEREKQKAAQK